jgi:pimeloyl-ACP methyl ester carboxylesterase
VVGVPAAGALYQTLSERREAGRFKPPGVRVDVGGRRLHLLCIGQGEPTVVFESGGFGGALSAAALRERVARETRVCSYDRMGMGWSDPGPAVISMGLLADDLQRLLERGGVRPPYVLVPASIGGLVVELFARRHPEQVAGLVFLDGAHSGVLERVAPRLTAITIAGACLARPLARLGLLRLLDPFKLRPSTNPAASIAFLYRPEPMGTLCGIVRGGSQSLGELRAAPPLRPDVPLVVLTADSTAGLVPPGFGSMAGEIVDHWRDLQQQLSRRSSHGRWQIVPGSGHALYNHQPDVVAAAVLDLVEHLRHAD